MDILLNILIGFGILFIVLVVIGLNTDPASIKVIESEIQTSRKPPLEIKFENHPEPEKAKVKFIIIDLETTGLPRNRSAPPEETSKWPRVVQIAWMLFDKDRNLVTRRSYILKQSKTIPQQATAIHGITNQIAKEQGVDPIIVYTELKSDLSRASYMVAHNIEFEYPILECEFIRHGFGRQLENKRTICTMKRSKAYVGIYKMYGNGFKYPKLSELVMTCFNEFDVNEVLENQHNAERDVELTAACLFQLINDNVIKNR